MAKKKGTHEVIQWLGRILTIFSYLIDEMEKRALPVMESFKLLATPDGRVVLDKLVEALAGQLVRIDGVFGVIVNYALSLEKMVAAGNYDWIAENGHLIDENISCYKFIKGDPAERKGQEGFGFETVRFERRHKKYHSSISIEDAHSELGKMNYDSTDFAGLSAFVAKYPKELRGGPVIVALGSVLEGPDGCRYIPCVGTDRHGKRFLSLHRIDESLVGVFRFLVVRKVRE